MLLFFPSGLVSRKSSSSLQVLFKADAVNLYMVLLKARHVGVWRVLLVIRCHVRETLCMFCSFAGYGWRGVFWALEAITLAETAGDVESWLSTSKDGMCASLFFSFASSRRA